MKKLTSVLLAALLLALTLTGCAAEKDQINETPAESADPAPAETESEKTVVRLGGLKGPTSMGLVKLLDDAEKNLTVNSYDFTMAAAADELTPGFMKGENDILAVPANLASILWNNSNGAVQVLAINTLGVLSIVEKGGEEIRDLTDLRGMTLYATGKGTTPEYALNYLLTQNGLNPAEDVTIVWKNEPTEVIAQMATEKHAAAMLPQPFVTVAMNQLSDLRVAVELTKAWDALDNGSRMVTAVLIVRRAFAEEHPEAVAEFLKEYKASADYANAFPGDAAALVEKYGIVKAAVAEKAIPYCGIVCLTGEEMKSALSGYLGTLFEQNPKSVGGTLPDDGFYISE